MNRHKIGTCSWNYDSWIGHVYTEKSSHSAGYLKEYAQRYRTVEIDSWFYKLPSAKEVNEYLTMVDDNFTFSCKCSQDLTLTHLRSFGKNDKVMQVNPHFLSGELFQRFTESIRMFYSRIDNIMLEFEYLNKEKMASLDTFIKHLDIFLSTVNSPLPLAIETRNKSYLVKEYFEFLKEKHVAHVFSEKIFMPHIYEIYEKFGHLLTERVVIRLLGGDRKEIEEKTGEKWDRIVDEKHDLHLIAGMIREMNSQEKSAFVFVNNHYEGSAPLTIERLQRMINE